MDKLRFESANLTAANIDKIAELFPGVVTEGKVNFDLLRSLLGDEVYGDEAYEFTWVGKRAAIAEAGRPIRKTLRPCVEESKNWDTTENLYIEGDNLDVLKLLQESYLGKVKMIYIDPPYNTGNDFVYRDNFTRDKDEYDEEAGVYDEDGDRLFRNTESNGRFHSDWCSMMYPRLVLARNLLRNDGVIFISIDDNEVAQLRKICDEVFGEKNFIANLVWEKKKKGAFLSKHYINMKEYIFVYAKNSTSFSGLVGEINSASETYPCIKTTNARGTRIIRKGTPSKYKESTYSISSGTRISSGNMELIFTNEARIVDNILQNDVVIDSNWIYSQLALDEYAKEGLLYITQDLYIRRIVNEDRTKMLKDLLFRVGSDGQSLSSFSYDANLNNGGWGTNEDANDELHQLLGQQYLFDFSKPSRLIAKLSQSVDDKDAIILDFFSGSATTAHAVMQLNAEDGGNRKFIMVQLPELCTPDSEAVKAGYKNICEIGKERIRRAGEKIKADNAGKEGIDDLDIGFRVLKLDDTNMKDVYYAASEYTQDLLSMMEDNIKDDRTDMDLLYACLLDWGLPLSMPHTQEKIGGFTVHTYNDGDLIACFDKHISDEVVKEIARRQPLRAVFRDSSFASSPEKINVEEIFKLLAPNTSVRVI
jgi:adenine-specific DNA-methyltransferase